MSLTLTITSSQRSAMGAASRFVVRGVSTTIGRAADNDWVLPADAHAGVSRIHARIDRSGPEYVITDLSSNGTFVNNSPRPVGNGSSQPLGPGDQILIGDFVINVEIHATQAPSAPDPIFFTPPVERQNQEPGREEGGSPPDWQDEPGPSSSHRPSHPVGFPSSERAKTVDDIIGEPHRPTSAPPRTVQHSSPENHHINPPIHTGSESHDTGGAGDSRSDGRPNDLTGWVPDSKQGSLARPPPPQDDLPSPLYREEHRPAQLPPEPARPHPVASVGPELERLLIAAGLDPAMARSALRDPQLAENIGEIFQVLITGMLEVLRARSKIKYEFRLPLTQFSADQNNPLKSARDARQALQSLLVHPQAGFLPPLEAVREGLDDIKAHQIAVFAGMRAAFDYMLEQFDPEALQQRFDRGGKSSGILGNNKARYWEQLTELYGDITEDPEKSFNRLFGEEFAKAYEQHMQRHSGGRRR